jgi:cystathionine beta-lyase/cystathionine gamma-synthase
MSTTFVRDPDNGYSSGHVYGRKDNATVQQAERQLAELEHARDAVLFGSGMAAATAVFTALPPTHTMAPCNRHRQLVGRRTRRVGCCRSYAAATPVISAQSSKALVRAAR